MKKYIFCLLLIVFPLKTYALSMVPFDGQSIANLVNDRRTENGLKRLAIDSTLCQVAQEKGLDMVFKGYFSHTSPDGTIVADMLTARGYKWYITGNNLAMNFNDTVSLIDAWMDSQTHRENILAENYNRTCAAVVSFVHDGQTTNYVVQVFSD